MPFDRLSPHSPRHGLLPQSEPARGDGRAEIGSSPAERAGEKASKTQYILTGFSQTAALRLYAFQGVGDGPRVDYTVQVDLSMIPTYGIRIQDLPLLCRDLLQNRAGSAEIRALTLGEHEMQGHAERLAAEREEAARRKNTGRHTVNANPSSGWRAPH